MAHTYGDAVTLVKKLADGSFVRSNAIVLSSALRVPTTLARIAVPNTEPQEHLDLASPVIAAVPPKSRDMSEIFRPTYDVGPFVDGAWLGWEPAAVAAAEPVDGQIVPLAELVDLSNAVSELDPTSEVCPDAVVPSATKALVKAISALSDADATITSKQAELADMAALKSTSDALLASAQSEVATLKTTIEAKDAEIAGLADELKAAKALPSAADLDAAAAEEAAKASTGTGAEEQQQP